MTQTAISNASTPTPTRYVGLDGLRAIAVTLVLIYHLMPGLLPGGFLGVDMFFVVSGFLITSLLLKERQTTGRVSFFGFWRRRARRLLPALWLVVLMCSSLAYLVGGDALVNLGRQIFGAATFSSNWVYIADGGSYFTRDTPELFRNLWSLAVEEQFYIVWPFFVLLLFALHTRFARILTVTLLGTGSALLMALNYVPGLDPTRAYFGSDTHSFGLFFGAGLALLLSRAHSNKNATGNGKTAPAPKLLVWCVGAVSALCLAAGSIWLTEKGGFTYQGGLLLVSLASVGMIWAATNPAIRLGLLLDSRPLRYIGERSYGLYLWHWPLLVLVLTAVKGTNVDPWLVGSFTLILTAALAHLSYRFVEQPVRRFGLLGSIRAAFSSISQNRMRFLTASVISALFLAGVVGSTAAITNSVRTNSATTNIARGEQALAEAQAQAEAAPPPGPAEAGASALPQGSQISAVGDSVMLASAPELQATFPGIAIDASVSRGLGSGVDIVATLAQSDQLRDVLVIGLGTNGPIRADSLEELRSTAGARPMVLVTAFAPREWIPGVNDELRAFAARYRNVELAQWSDAIAAHTDLLAGDQIHPGAAGGEIYAVAVQDALQRLAALPPLRDSSGFGLAGPPS